MARAPASRCAASCPRARRAAKLAQAEAAGARVVLVNGGYSDAYALAARAAERFGWANLTSTYVNPYMLEGDKTLGLELWEQLGGRTPDWVVVPVGAGPLLAAVGKAWDELREHGLVTGAGPRLMGVQASGCAPIVRAFEARADAVAEWDGPTSTSASSIADPLRGYAADGTRTLGVIRRSGGLAIGVSEAGIAGAVDRLARLEGVLAEPGAGAALAGYELALERGLVSPGRAHGDRRDRARPQGRRRAGRRRRGGGGRRAGRRRGRGDAAGGGRWLSCASPSWASGASAGCTPRRCAGFPAAGWQRSATPIRRSSSAAATSGRWPIATSRSTTCWPGPPSTRWTSSPARPTTAGRPAWRSRPVAPCSSRSRWPRGSTRRRRCRRWPRRPGCRSASATSRASTHATPSCGGNARPAASAASRW